MCNNDLKSTGLASPETPPKVAVSKDFLMMKFGANKFDFDPRISKWADQVDNHFGTKKCGR